MRKELNGLKEQIESHLVSAYGIEPVEMTFLPVGEESTSYRFEAGEETYLVKHNADRTTLEQTVKTHSLLLELATFPFIIPPVKTIAQTTVHEVDTGYISVFPFVKGPLVVEENTDFHEELVEKLVGITVALQNSTTQIQTELQKENFDTNHAGLLQKLIALAKQYPNKKYAQIALQNEKKIQKLIEGQSTLNDFYKNNMPPLVLTHGDITGLNIIQVSGDIKLIDWDSAMLAPKERDLMFLTDSPFFNREEYLKQVTETEIDEQLVSYYKLRWALESIVKNLHDVATKKFNELDEKVKLAEVIEYLGYY